MPDLPALIAALSRPDAYPFPAGAIEVHQTHISVVFLAGGFAYKLKKPVRLPFLDFSTLGQRRHFCEEEVRLNRRLAPDVYLGMVGVNAELRVEGPGEPVEWAVKMRRLPVEATLESRLGRDEVTPAHLAALARKVAAFHAAAEPCTPFGSLATVAANARANFTEAASQVGRTVRAAVYERLVQLTEEQLQRHGPLIAARARRGVPRDTHGDLHLDHVYLFPDRPAPDDLVVIDCIEFAERFRCADPVADMAFLTMDLIAHGRRDLARVFADAYFDAAGDADGRDLLPFYVAYRALVRAKVEGIELEEAEVPAGEKAQAHRRAQAHWLVALGALEGPANRPALVLIGGLPGAGKSTLARALGARARFHVLRSDVVRKELAGVPEQQSATVGYEQGIYDAGWTQRTYDELLRRVGAMLVEGERVIVDASFRSEAQRRQFLDAARDWGVPALFLHCMADVATVQQRLAQRRGDASDADWAIHVRAAQDWAMPQAATLRAYRAVATDVDGTAVLVRALGLLNAEGLG